MFCERKWYYEEKTVILTKNIFFGIIDILYCKGDNQMFNNEQDFEEWRVDCLNKAKEILTMDKEKENNRSKKNRDDSELTVAFIFLCNSI